MKNKLKGGIESIIALIIIVGIVVWQVRRRKK